VGMVLVSTVGGASGPLYGTFFLRLGAALAGRSTVEATDFAAAFRAGVEGVAGRGRAAAGDKTMLDALLPAVAAFAERAEDGAASAWQAAVTAAEAGRDATGPMVARKGRASYLGERSAGHVDPGATSATLLVAAGAATLGAAGD
jgi:dihydroxyacetone kinase phosphoprotein-dependent L subunit